MQCEKSTTALMDRDNAEKMCTVLILTSWTITIYKHNDLQAQWVIPMEHMKEKGLVEHKVEVPTYTLILAQPTSRKITLLQACEIEYWNLIVQIRQSAPLFLWYNVQPVMHHKTTWRQKCPHNVVTCVIGASLSEPHTSESNGGFFIYYYYYIYIFICRTYVVP